MLGAVALPIVFVAGVWVGTTGQGEAVASSTTTTNPVDPPTTSSTG